VVRGDKSSERGGYGTVITITSVGREIAIERKRKKIERHTRTDISFGRFLFSPKNQKTKQTNRYRGGFLGSSTSFAIDDAGRGTSKTVFLAEIQMRARKKSFTLFLENVKTVVQRVFAR